MQNFLNFIRLLPLTAESLPGPVITSLSPQGAPVGASVTVMGAKFGDDKQPTKSITFNGLPAVPISWSDTQIVTKVPIGAKSGDVIVAAAGVASNGVPFTVGSPGSAEWVLLPSGALEHAKWLDGSRLQRLMSVDLDVSYVTLLPNKQVNDLSDVILSQHGRFIAVVEEDKTFRCLIDRSAILEKLAPEVSKQVSSSKP